MKKLLVVLAMAAAVSLPASAARFRGGVFFGSGFGYGPWGGWYGPYASPYYGGYPMMVHPNAGQVKLDTKLKDAQVFINGTYAGTVKELKSMWIHQGSYDLELRAPNGARFERQIFVVNGKTIHINPGFDPRSNS